jgi:serine/threonine protein kinase
MSLSPGSRLGPYEIVAPIGSGGMGEVYKARDTRLNRTIAVKISAEQRFLVNTRTGEPSANPITVVLNWTAGLKK